MACYCLSLVANHQAASGSGELVREQCSSGPGEKPTTTQPINTDERPALDSHECMHSQLVTATACLLAAARIFLVPILYHADKQ
jgi:hypothetical protein